MLIIFKSLTQFISVIFYIVAPIPYSLARRYSETSYSGSNCGLEVALFLTSLLVISAYGWFYFYFNLVENIFL